ncbi:DUF1684 domain-containing protein [Leadbetterella byssophila]|uniref:DUF1684 domain-containing protein n=1 Tax=Leadbetterella byssophila (strain DSM 17132 / JCM 16389 / KACC 11308 / NBRC 106382 / 4M15) TaxID=649349 RepID=E4RW89_LEAB4|nr:DUF1684 domain-containing protein [Leadbetterella byssophila]ADQ17124.1 protein of unknown function DUF1684 [Leadbetterella byssophila DSM 17132]
MFRNKFVLGIIVLGVGLIAYYMFSGAPTYAELAEKDREAYKNSMVTMKDSPVKTKAGFDFYAPDEKWVLEAKFEKAENDREFKLQMTNDSLETAHLAGYATIEVEGQSFRLLVFDEGANYLLPFKDRTNGSGTYGGGRYINIEKGKLVGKRLTVDFNHSHNFYCAYEESFVCPVPPRENNLPIEVPVGEKIYKK